jgi:hypothetical protein
MAAAVARAAGVAVAVAQACVAAAPTGAVAFSAFLFGRRDLSGSSRGTAGAAQHVVKLALAIECIQIVASADGLSADEDLRDRPLAGNLDQMFSRLRIGADVDFSVRYAFLSEQLLGTDAVGADRCRIDQDGIDHGNVVTVRPRLRAVKAPKPSSSSGRLATSGRIGVGRADLRLARTCVPC